MVRKRGAAYPASKAHEHNDMALNTRLHQAFLQAQEGRLLPEIIPLSAVKNVLDLGCGAGDWIFQLARRYPHMHIYGIDYCEQALQEARVRYEISALRQVELRQTDFLQALSTPDHYFDLVHMRRGAAFITPEQWPKFIWECTRTLKVGGWITFVEFEVDEIASSACMELHRVTLQALRQLKLNMETTGMSYGAPQRLYSILHQAPFDEIGYELYPADMGFLSGEAGQAFLAAMMSQFRQYKVQVVQLRFLSEKRFDALLARAQQEIQAPDLCGWGTITTVYGRRSER
ncbi:MAG: class I SAM-dependent methyltransferase [Ktedonobacteraceae bacterium]|nr:class I SAM-dependent methyltransferase [Ktedonobacteraceae bacterium]